MRNRHDSTLCPNMDHVFPIQALHTASLNRYHGSRRPIRPAGVLIESHPTLWAEVAVHRVSAVGWVGEKLQLVLSLRRQVGHKGLGRIEG
jgi:hypothetical protein